MSWNTGSRSLPVAPRFEGMFIPEPNSGCWIWMGAATRQGYGRLSAQGIPTPAHRVSYELHKGKIPQGLHIDHLCRNTSCVNPDHLEAVTNKENGRRGIVAEVHRARQAAKTHCKHGHPLSGDNLYIAPSSGQRVCRACKADRKKARRAAQPKPPNRDGLALGGAANGERQRAKTHCPKGHPYSGDNLRVNSATGYRECRKCAAASTRRYISRKLNK